LKELQLTVIAMNN